MPARHALIVLAAPILLLACSPDAPPPGDAGPDAGPPPDAAPADAAPPDGGPTQAGALAELAEATVRLDADWRFRTDPEDDGQAAGWMGEAWDDGDWGFIDAGATWEDQGYPGYDGVAWYRRRVAIPADWSGSPVRWLASGVDDEYDLYVNGALVAHYGEPPDRSVWGWQTRADLTEHLRFGEDNLIALRVVDWGNGGGVWRGVTIRRSVPLAPWRELLPEPVLDRPDLVALYWVAWQLAFDKVSFGTPESGLVAAFMDEGFNEQIYQWDSAFMCLFGRYGHRLFPVMPTLDNFYARQRPDGYIQRVYSETDGGELQEPTAEEPMVNPPLFAWVEWEWARFTGDTSRLAAVRPVLERYHGWLRANLRGPTGLYRQTPLGSGMDNVPRGDPPATGYVDMTAQMALAARSLARIADAVGDATAADAWELEHEAIAADVASQLWATTEGFYMDRRDDGTLTGVEHLGALWTLLAEMVPSDHAASLVAHLEDPAAFHRAHLFPSLSAADPAYDPAGSYWHGGVWAPTNYATIRGLVLAGAEDLAREAAANHLDRVASVYAAPPGDASRIAPEERDGDYATIWECYAPDAVAPATRWDGTYLSRQDFVGWSGLGPIALLLEQVIGLDVEGVQGRVIWTVTRTDRHGVLRLPLGEGTVDLVAAARAGAGEPLHVDVTSDRPLALEIRRPGKATQVLLVPPGASGWDLQ